MHCALSRALAHISATASAATLATAMCSSAPLAFLLSDNAPHSTITVASLWSRLAVVSRFCPPVGHAAGQPFGQAGLLCKPVTSHMLIVADDFRREFLDKLRLAFCSSDLFTFVYIFVHIFVYICSRVQILPVIAST